MVPERQPRGKQSAGLDIYGICHHVYRDSLGIHVPILYPSEKGLGPAQVVGLLAGQFYGATVPSALVELRSQIPWTLITLHCHLLYSIHRTGVHGVHLGPLGRPGATSRLLP